MLQFSFSQYLKSNDPSIQQQETITHVFSIILMGLHKTLRPIVNFENMQVPLHI
jgi:hypothetical protein